MWWGVELFSFRIGPGQAVAGLGMSVDAAGRLELRWTSERGARFALPACDVVGLRGHDSRRDGASGLLAHQDYLVGRNRKCDASSMVCVRSGCRGARPGSGFTLLFEALVMTLVTETRRRRRRAGRQHGIRIGRDVHDYVDPPQGAQVPLHGHSGGHTVDETSSRRGQSDPTRPR